tara:strand:+ start:4434 stop:6509 length:2076 start_codon:yes stop_codon:yes gene_type:complete
MALTLEVNYFNSFYLKRLAGGDSNSGAASAGLDKKLTLPLPPSLNYSSLTPTLNTGYPWVAPMTTSPDADWYIEESRIRGGYNNTSVDLGVKAYIVSEEPNQNIRGNSLIYSGVFNSRTGINNTNQFSVAEEITRSVDPKGGTIQKLFAEDTNLTVFQERKVNVALIDKDAIYSAEGSSISTTANVVIGQITPIPGNWGISTNPESFATYGYTKYFVDKDRNAVLKIEGTQLQEIHVAGMTDFYRDQLSTVGENDAILGTWDVYNMNYVLSIQTGGTSSNPARFNTAATYKTLTWDERNKGWTSFFTYKPETFFSCRGQFYSTTIGSADTGYELVGSISVNTLNGVDGTYTGTVGVDAGYTSNVSGTGLNITVTISGNTCTSIIVNTLGSGFIADERISISTTVIGGTLSVDVQLTEADLNYVQPNSNLYLHYSNTNRNMFYNTSSASSVQFVFNPMPNFIKTFKTVNYEGSNGWEITQFDSENTGQDPTITPVGGWLSHFDSIAGGGSPITSLGATATLVSSITTQTVDATDGTYNNAEWTTSGNGYGLVWNIGVGGNEVSSITVTNAGNGFKEGDTITIPTGVIGGTTNVVVTLQAVDVSPYLKIYSYEEGSYIEDNIQYRAGFDRKQNKYYAVVPNNTLTPMAGEVIFGNQTMGVKAYYSTVTIKTDTTTDPNGPKSLFAVSSEYINK